MTCVTPYVPSWLREGGSYPGALPEIYLPNIAALRLYRGPSTTVELVARDYFDDNAGGVFAVVPGDETTPDDGALWIVDALNRRWHRRFHGRANVRWWGAKGDGTTDDTQALMAFFGANGPKDGWLTDGTYRVGHYLRISGSFRSFEAGGNATIKMDRTLTRDLGGIYRIQPVLIADTTASDITIRGLTVDHRGMDWPVYPASDFTEEIFGSPVGGDGSRGCAILIMGDKATLDNVTVLNGWDNGISVGTFNETTGAVVAGPDEPHVVNCKGFNNGVGKHAWGDAPGGYYFQGAFVDFLHATNFVCSNCTDYGSYNGFYADINGGATGKFTACIAKNTQVGPIFSDSASGGNQPWNQGGFGQTITDPGSGWLKTPGGVAFYSGSYDVHFVNCHAENPGLYGFVLDYFAVANTLTSCSAYNAGISNFVVSGGPHTLVGCKNYGGGQKIGTVSPSGSTCPASPAVLVTGMQDTGTGVNVDGECEIIGMEILPDRVYPNVAPPAANYNYGIYARTRNGRTARVTAFGCSRITAGTSGQFGADASSRVDILTTGFASRAGEITINTIGASAVVNMTSGGSDPLQINQSATGDANVVNFASGKRLTIDQRGSGAQILFKINGTDRFLMHGAAVRYMNPPTSTSGLSTNDMYVDTGASNVLKLAP